MSIIIDKIQIELLKTFSKKKLLREISNRNSGEFQKLIFAKYFEQITQRNPKSNYWLKFALNLCETDLKTLTKTSRFVTEIYLLNLLSHIIQRVTSELIQEIFQESPNN